MAKKKALILIYIDFLPDIKQRESRILSTELSPACVSTVSSGVFTTSNEVWCVFLFGQHKHYAVAFKIQEDILGQPAKVWRLQTKLIYELFLVWLVSFRAEEKHCKALKFQQASSYILGSFTIYLDLWVWIYFNLRCSICFMYAILHFVFILS